MLCGIPVPSLIHTKVLVLVKPQIFRSIEEVGFVSHCCISPAALFNENTFFKGQAVYFIGIQINFGV
jgi:hypothetical protein